MGEKITYYFLLQKWVSNTDIFLHTLCNSILRSTSCYAKKFSKKFYQRLSKVAGFDDGQKRC